MIRDRKGPALACVSAILLAFLAADVCLASPESDASIRMYVANPRYWEHRGKPVLLLGGSIEDNLFQIPDLEAHLDLLASVGGNYVRNTMSARDDGNVWPFDQENGQYDLERWNEEYWGRFDLFLELTDERNVIVQVEIWATFDYYRDCWDRNPFNPKNNINYTPAESGLPVEVNSHPLRTENNFFWSVPAERNQPVVLKYQRRFVDKLLSYSLKHGNVLYCMDNETAVTPEWGKYWSEYIKIKAREAGVHIETTEMWDPWNLRDAKHKATFDHPETYSFVDVSQNNHNTGQAHWDGLLEARQRLAETPRPMNNVKIYGAYTGQFGTTRDGLERLWRNVFGGAAAVRFHRPDSGLGLSAEAQASIRSMRMLTDRMDVFSCEPHNELLSNREPNEAYCTANPGKEYAVYFPDGGSVVLNAAGLDGEVATIWLDIMESQWKPATAMPDGAGLVLESPGRGHWACLIQRDAQP